MTMPKGWSKEKLEDLIEKGRKSNNDKKYPEALTYFKRAINLDKTYLQAYVYAGYTLYKMKKYPEALTYFKQVINKDDSYLQAYVYAGSALYKMDRYFYAIHWFDRALIFPSKLDDDLYVKALEEKGLCLLKLGLNKEALMCFSELEEILKDVFVYFNIAKICYELSYFDISEKYYDKAISRSNELSDTTVNHKQLKYKVDALNGKAWLFANTNRHYDAELYINEAIDLIPKLKHNDIKSKILDTKGFIFYKKGIEQKNNSYFKKAINLFDDAKKAIDLLDDDDDAKKNKEKLFPNLHIGMTYLELKNYDKAEEFFDKVLNINSRTAEALNGKAVVFNHKGKKDEAVEFVKKALQYKPSLTAAHDNLIRLNLSSSNEYQSFWNFWNLSLGRRIVAILLGIAAISVIIYPIYEYQGFSNIDRTEINGNNSTTRNFSDLTSITNKIQLQIDYSFLIIFGTIIFIILSPGLKKAKIGDIVELETSHQPLLSPPNIQNVGLGM
jgi:tetratricopeptide (TPR) repeat protein